MSRDDSRNPPDLSVGRFNEQEQYYLQESETIVGNCMLFWRKDRKGYTTNLDEAHIFTREEALAQQRCRETDIPWPKKTLDKVAQRTVDIQHIKERL